MEPGRDWINLIVCKDPETGFGQTVENLFTSANLLRHGDMETYIGSTSENKNTKRAEYGLEDIRGLPVFLSTERVANSADISKPDVACVVTLDTAQWKELCEVCDESCDVRMPTRDYENGEYSKFMLDSRDANLNEDGQGTTEEEIDVYGEE